VHSMSSETHAYAFTSTSPPAVALAPPAQPGSCNVQRLGERRAAVAVDDAGALAARPFDLELGVNLD